MFKNRIKPLLLILSVLFSALAQAQDSDKKYQALLWEISGNGAKSNSYLYGTMHVSNKVAFHLSDSFFLAINSVDKVALESDPSQWMKEIFDQDYIDEFGSQYQASPYLRDFYKEAFQFEGRESKLLGQVISHNNYMMNGMLYRNSAVNTEHEENTYLDMYIFQAGKKLGKDVIGLEDFMESQKLVEKSSKPDEDKDYIKKQRKKLQKMMKDGKRPGELLEDAYRRGDLDLLDSLQALMNPSRNHRKYMLDVRNEIMADNIDSIIKNGESLFSGIGSAHLPGDMGVIELLRRKGYTLRPVTRVIGDYSRDFRDKLEKTYVDVPFQKQVASDGMFEISLPGTMFELPENFGMKFYLCPEMMNGTQFNISRVRTDARLVHQSKEYMLKRIDSLLYENIPGKILGDINHFTKNGYPAIGIKNRTRKGDHQRYLIVITDLELIIFKVAGTLEYMKDNDYLDNVFNSIEIKAPTSKWTTYKPEYGSFTIDMPGNILQEDQNPVISHLVSSRKAIQSFDPSDSSFYYLGRIGLHEYHYIEEDTFELSFMAGKLAKAMNYKELNRELGSLGGYPSLDITYKDSMRYAHIKSVIQGPRYFLLLAQTKDSIRPERFFNSFTIQDLAYSKPFKEYEDTNLYYTVNTPVEPQKTRSYYNYSRYNDDDDEEDKSHEEENKRASYKTSQTDEQILVEYQKFHRYFSKPSLDSFWKWQETGLTDRDLYIKSRNMSADSMIYTMIVVDTNSNRAIDIKHQLKSGVLYSLYSLTDTLTGRSKFVDEFYSSFTPSTDTVIGQPVSQNKADLFFEHLYGDDSIKREQALSSYNYVHLEDRHFDQALHMFESFEHKDFTLAERAGLLSEIAVLKNPKCLPYLENLYRNSVDTPIFQTSILGALSSRNEKSSRQLFKKLLESETPLSDEQTIYYMLSGLYDSLELSRPLYPMLFEFTRYPEYKDVVYGIYARMLDSGIVSRKHYKSQKKLLLREAKDELKRTVGKNSGNESNIEGFIDYAYYNRNIYTLNKLLMPFCKDDGVQEYFSRIDRSGNINMRLDKDLLLLKNGEAVNDTIWEYYASLGNFRKKVYSELEELKRLDLFPEKYKNQESMIMAQVFSYGDVNPEDSTAILCKRKIEFKGDKGYLYFVKHKDRYNEDDWNIDYYGVQPLDSTKFELYSKVSQTDMDIDLEDEEEVEKKIKEIIELLKFKHRQRVVPEGRNPYYGYGY